MKLYLDVIVATSAMVEVHHDFSSDHDYVPPGLQSLSHHAHSRRREGGLNSLHHTEPIQSFPQMRCFAGCYSEQFC